MRVLLVLALALTTSFSAATPRAEPLGSDVSSAQVTVYGAAWCSACKSLEASLRSRNIPFAQVDVDENPGAFAIAKKATGTNAIPITNILRGPTHTWIVGANPDAVERAYKGE